MGGLAGAVSPGVAGAAAPAALSNEANMLCQLDRKLPLPVAGFRSVPVPL